MAALSRQQVAATEAHGPGRLALEAVSAEQSAQMQQRPYPSPGRYAPEAVSAFVGLGANLGDAPATLAWAVQALAELPLSRVLSVSSLYASAALDCEPGSPDFFNAVVQLQTTLSAPMLLHALWRLELQAGRQRPYRNAPRTLDLDLLLYGEAHIASAQLTVPHPRMHQRAFVLHPLAEIAPERVSALQLQAVANQGVHQAGPLHFLQPS